VRSDVPHEPWTADPEAEPSVASANGAGPGLDGLHAPSDPDWLHAPRDEPRGLPRWGIDLPDGSDVDRRYAALFDRAAQTVLWSTAEQLAQQFVPGAPSLVRIAYYLGRYQAIRGGLNEGRDPGPAAGLSLGFTLRLGAWDDGVRPRFGVLIELNFMDLPADGDPDFDGPSRAALVVTEPREPFSSLKDLFGDEAVRDHTTVLGLAASLTADEVSGLVRALRRRWVRLTAKFDHAGLGTVTVHDGSNLEICQVQL